MKEIIGFIKAYYNEVNKPVLLFCTLFVAGLVYFNYQFGLENRLIKQLSAFPGHFLIYLAAFAVPHLALLLKKNLPFFESPPLLIGLVAAPMVFAFKVSMDTHINVSGNEDWNQYWNTIIYWPMRMITLVGILGVCWLLFNRKDNFYGLSAKKFSYTPYLLMLLIMLPLLAAASTQPDFLATYPKMKEIIPLPAEATPHWLYKLLFQLSYGSDFFSVEIFFRGFLIVGFLKWVGSDAILPMACFYCTIHFGKPLGECISSYFGGLLLGIVAYNTSSIYGGLMVHLGIAWMMELGGYIGNSIK
jgi:hypothetical protein